jgi:hypothetical protein
MGLQFVYVFLLGSDNGEYIYNSVNPIIKTGTNNLPAASQIAQQMQQQQMPVGPMAPGQDPSKMFKAEAENLAVVEHYSVLDGIEERLLERIKV